MATVYLARDLKHQRLVALKVLDPELGAVLGADRFLSEINVTANLQHPNLLPLFDSGEADKLLFYVMPYVEGESLRARLEREKQLPVDEAVRIAVAVANALGYAHERGVIHRDLKPENILLQHGQPVIADFGIALALSRAGGARVTQTGLSLGTPQYMSPEQATGDRTIDARSDIYSLGAVTYEMLSGEPPHTGTSAQAIVAKLLTEEVRPITVLRRSVPAQVDAAVRHALQKLPSDRFATAEEFVLAITGVRPIDPPVTSTGAARAAMRKRSSLVPMALVALGAAIAGAGLMSVWAGARRSPSPLPTRFELGLPDSVAVASVVGPRVAISRDGSKIVLVGVKNRTVALYLRRMDERVAHQIAGSELTVSARVGPSPTFSIDGNWVVFNAGGQLKKVAITGGTQQFVADSGYSPSWGANGLVLYRRGPSDLWLGSSDGGFGRRVAGRDTSRGIGALLSPWLLPDGRHALVAILPSRPTNAADSVPHIGIASLSDSSVKAVGVEGRDAHYVATDGGYIVFVRRGSLFAAPFALRKMDVTGPARLLVDGAEAGAGGIGGFDVSDNGTLVYHGGGSPNRELVAVGLDGSEHVIPGPTVEVQSPRVSPDGRRAVYGNATVAGNGDLWLADLSSGTRERLTVENGGSRGVWTRDGGRVLFVRSGKEPGVREVVSRAWDRSAEDRLILTDSVHEPSELAIGPSHGYSLIRGNEASPSPRGQRIRALTRGDIFIAPTDSLSAMRPFVATRAGEYDPVVSADGRFAAYMSDETGTPEIYVQPIPGPGPRVKVSLQGGSEPLWSPKGTVVYYRGASRVIAAQLGVSPLAVIRRDSLFFDRYVSSANTHEWDIFPDGQRFLMSRPPLSVNATVITLLNWPQLKGSASAPPSP
jgi:eukaryotic-like serine/threonine-protein kinase